MSKIEKLIERLKSKPKDFTYDEMKTVLNYFGYYESNKGKTSGSSVSFINEKNDKFDFHKPHPNKIIKQYLIKKIINFFEERGLL
ncbi:MAG: type II toxin-antitoxin system HicA family toxin [Clostridia bacterium]|nr:type II toxin-antitoxin system HicA family toxin [Clostridia bacterium]